MGYPTPEELHSAGSTCVEDEWDERRGVWVVLPHPGRAAVRRRWREVEELESRWE